MALFNIFKKNPLFPRRKKKEEKPQKKTKPEAAPKKAVRKEAKKPVVSQKPKRVSEFGYRVLKSPQVTEKATDLLQKNQYVFKVYPRANKAEVKKAIEDAYGVDVESVRMINIPGKKRRLGRIEGWRSGTKKAIVRVKEGQKIEVLPR